MVRAVLTSLRHVRALTVTVGAVALSLGLAGDARAQSSSQLRDGIYGRLSGDLVLSGEVFGGLSSRADGSAFGGAAFRLRALDMTGLVVGYDWAFAPGRGDALWFGVDLRPAMLARISFDSERGPRWFDLMIDSIGIDLGGAWVRPGEALGNGSGLSFMLGTGVEVPLSWSNGGGWMLRLSGRWYSAQRWDAQGTGRDDSAWQVGLGVVWRATVNAGLVRAP